MSNEFIRMQLSNGVATNQDDAKKTGGDWFETMADAWGEALDAQANRIVQQSEAVANGLDSPSQITALTAESLRMGFISNSSHTALTSVASALENLARKQ